MTAAAAGSQCIESAQGAQSTESAESAETVPEPDHEPDTALPPLGGVAAGRARIDDIDRRILALVAERIEAAASIQAARVAEGGRRVDLKRESEIIARYRTALGRPGTAVAMQVLELCRGKI